MAWRETGVALATMPAGTMREATIDGQSVLLVRLADAIYAFEGICPHAGGILANGTLDAVKVTCPEHGAGYDATSGEVLVDPDGIVPPAGGTSALRKYPTRIAKGAVEVDLD
jgi:nitrite reductase/ring-hydroxylating ferredoxin subunit